MPSGKSMPDATSQSNINHTPSMMGDYLIGLQIPVALQTAREQGRVPRTPEEHRGVQKVISDHTDSACSRINEWVASSNENGPLEILFVFRGIGQISVRCTEVVVNKLKIDLPDIILDICRSPEGRIY